MIDILFLALALLVLIIGSYTDIKTREVPDWVNFGFIFSGIGLRLLFSVSTFDWSYIIDGVIGLVVFVVLGYIMFYSGQWGGGDSKMLMGMGAMLGLNFHSFNQLLLVFLVNVLFVGAFYGLFYSVVLAIKNKKLFFKNWDKLMDKYHLFRKYLLAFFLVCSVIILISSDSLFFWLWFAVLFLIYFSVYLLFFVKAVELSSMYKLINPNQLTEGDWIAKIYKFKGKYLAGPKDLGVSKQQIKKFIKLKSKVKIKVGIPFVPSFLLAFILTLIFGAWWIVLF